MEAHIHKDNGEIVSRQYARRRVSAYLSKYRRIYALQERQQAMAKTIDCDEWFQRKHGYTIGALCRAVEDEI